MHRAPPDRLRRPGGTRCSRCALHIDTSPDIARRNRRSHRRRMKRTRPAFSRGSAVLASNGRAVPVVVGALGVSVPSAVRAQQLAGGALSGSAIRYGSSGSEGGRRSHEQRGHRPSRFLRATTLLVRRWDAGTPSASQKAGAVGRSGSFSGLNHKKAVRVEIGEPAEHLDFVGRLVSDLPSDGVVRMTVEELGDPLLHGPVVLIPPGFRR